MPLDKIVVIIMAIMFFGGLAYIIWKGRQQEKAGGPAAPNSVEGSAPNNPREKGRKRSG